MGLSKAAASRAVSSRARISPRPSGVLPARGWGCRRVDDAARVARPPRQRQRRRQRFKRRRRRRRPVWRPRAGRPSIGCGLWGSGCRGYGAVAATTAAVGGGGGGGDGGGGRGAGSGAAAVAAMAVAATTTTAAALAAGAAAAAAAAAAVVGVDRWNILGYLKV